MKRYTVRASSEPSFVLIPVRGELRKLDTSPAALAAVVGDGVGMELGGSQILFMHAYQPALPLNPRASQLAGVDVNGDAVMVENHPHWLRG
jgi:hypothetical protein